MDTFTLFVIIGSIIAIITFYLALCLVFPEIVAGGITSILTMIAVLIFNPISDSD